MQVLGPGLPTLFPGRLCGLGVESGFVEPGGPRGVVCPLCRERAPGVGLVAGAQC